MVDESEQCEGLVSGGQRCPEERIAELTTMLLDSQGMPLQILVKQFCEIHLDIYMNGMQGAEFN